MEYSLLQLYQLILIPVFSEWISDTDLCYLDAAVTNHVRRKDFLAVLMKSHVHCSIGKQYYDEYCDWVELRGLGLKSVHFQTKWYWHTKQKILSLLKRTKHIDFLRVDTLINPVGDLGELGLSVQKLKIENWSTMDSFQTILSGNQIVNLEIAHCSEVNDSIINRIPELCQVLRKLTVHVKVSVLKIVEQCELEEVTCGLTAVCGPECPPSLSKCLVTLHRTQEESANVINIAGKLYRLTKFYVENFMTKDDVTYLTPILGHLQSVVLICELTTTMHCELLIKAIAASDCGSLTHFSTSSVTCGDMTHFFQRLIHLRYISVTHYVNVAEVTALATHCPLLEYVSIPSAILPEGPIVLLLCNCLNLQYLNIGKSKITDSMISHVVNNVDVISLSLNFGATTMKWDSNRCLKSFSASIVDTMSVERFPILLERNTGLQKIDLTGLHLLVDESLLSLVTLCPLLKDVGIDSCRLITAEGLSHLTQLKHLNSLRLANMSVVTDALVESLARDKSVTRLVLRYCEGLTDGVLTLIVMYCPLLSHLEVSRNSKISTRSVLLLLEGCADLVYLNLEHCIKISSDICFALASHRPMRYVNIRGCSVSREIVNEVVKSGFSCSCEFIR